MDKAALILVIFGAINWGLVGLLRFDAIAFLCGGSGAMLSRAIYAVIAAAGFWSISLLFRDDVRGPAED